MAASQRESDRHIANLMILGESFVSRLETSLQHGDHVYCPETDGPLHVFARDALKSPMEINHVFFHGVSGAGCTPNSSKPFKLPGPVLLRTNPKLAIIEIGGNDVDSPAVPDEITIHKVELAHNLIQLYDVRLVALTTILPRETCRSVTPGLFREKAHLVNLITSRLLEDHPNIVFLKHKGFWKDAVGKRISTSTWSTDGVHPDTDLGRKKYQKSLTACLHDLVKVYRKLD